MQLAYDAVDLLFEADGTASDDAGHAVDRAPQMPLIGFLLASGVALPLWALIGWAVWVLVA